MHAVIHGPNAQEDPAATLKMPHLQTPVIDRSFPSLRQGANDCSVSLTVFIPFVIFRYMSLRTSTSRWITLSRAPPIRAISTSLPRRAKHGEHHDDPAEDSSYNTHECKLISARQTPAHQADRHAILLPFLFVTCPIHSIADIPSLLFPRLAQHPHPPNPLRPSLPLPPLPHLNLVLAHPRPRETHLQPHRPFHSIHHPPHRPGYPRCVSLDGEER